jgi:hypothetical protein
MRDILLRDCIKFQDCFLFDGKFSPFEKVTNFRAYYPRVLIGEIGGLFNLSCKSLRSPNTYEEEIEDECVDIFIYLLLFGRMLEIHDQRQVLGLIGKHWAKPVPAVQTEESYYTQCEGMMEKALCFLKPGKERYYNGNHFYEIFSSIQQVSEFITKKNWQYIINKFHQQVIRKHTDVNCFTMDGLYKGSFRINVDSLLSFIDKIEIELPEKRIDFLKRMKAVQSTFWPTISSENSVKSAGA